uniref:Uncharacterized protein n=1 Tax=Setaria viridis TaxID=4556 RepID=A0A4U6V173_SETVI|nr:hypothetical protein SEVIR_4G251900v2 [Setaria viridis]
MGEWEGPCSGAVDDKRLVSGDIYTGNVPISLRPLYPLLFLFPGVPPCPETRGWKGRVRLPLPALCSSWPRARLLRAAHPISGHPAPVDIRGLEANREWKDKCRQ